MNFFPTVCEGWEKNIYNQISEFGIKSGNSKSSYFVRPGAGPLNYYTDNMTIDDRNGNPMAFRTKSFT